MRPWPTVTGSLLLLAACASVPPSSPAPIPAPDFRFIILSSGLEDPPDDERALIALDLSEIACADRLGQRFQLTPDASQRLVSAARTHADRREEVVRLNRLKADLGHANRLERDLYVKKFRVEVNGGIVYRGIFLDATSNRLMFEPVARVGYVTDRVQIDLLPAHVPFAAIDPVFTTDADPSFRWLADRPATLANRKALRAPAVREALEVAGKLRPCPDPEPAPERP